SQLPQSIVDCLKLRIQNTKIRGKKCELNEESDNLKGLFVRTCRDGLVLETVPAQSLSQR
ncbi:hypothetical protein PROFUN_16886, partial [Planoprotostelium fungivorum]